jgi:GNAT superfamily N-acetyltransferase
MIDAPLTEVLTTRSGFQFQVRSAVPADDRMLAEFFHSVTPEDLRFRFFSGMDEVSANRISVLTHPDHNRTDSFVALLADGLTTIATAMLASDAKFERGEVAIVIRQDYKNQGVGWALLEYIARIAETMGLQILESIESRDNHRAIELERDMGFLATEYPGDATLILLSKVLKGTASGADGGAQWKNHQSIAPRNTTGNMPVK